MLSLVVMNVGLLGTGLIFKSSWYLRLWGLMLGSFFSLKFLYFSINGMTVESSWVMVDGLSSCLIALTWWVSSLMMLASQSSVKVSHNNPEGFSLFICLLNLVLTVTFLMSNIIGFYVFFELSLIPTLILILGWGYQPERLQAGMYMMLYTVGASLPLLILIMVTGIEKSSFSFYYSSLIGGSVFSCGWIGEIMFLVMIGAFLVKLPIFSVHLWLPKAHVEAPVAGSMILAGVLLKLGGYGVLRMYQYSVSLNGIVSDFMLVLGLWGGVVTSLMCIRQVDLKSLVAYSSVGHMGVMLSGLLTSCVWGWSGGLGMMLAHGLCSSALFSMVNMLYEKSGSRSLLLNKGFLLIIPSFSLWWFMFCAINMSAPPSINLISEIFIIPGIMYFSFICFVFFMMISFLAAVYNLFLYTSTQHGAKPLTLNSLSSMKESNFLVIFMHWVPVNFLIFKLDIICSWI